MTPEQLAAEEAEFERQEAIIKRLIQTLTYPNLNLIEKYVAKGKNHDLYATQTTIII